MMLRNDQPTAASTLNKGGLGHWRRKPKTKPIDRALLANPEFKDLRGRRFGTFTVCGFMGKRGAQAVARWLVRCTCGDYECRTAKAIKGPGAERDECARCTACRLEGGRGSR